MNTQVPPLLGARLSRLQNATYPGTLTRNGVLISFNAITSYLQIKSIITSFSSLLLTEFIFQDIIDKGLCGPNGNGLARSQLRRHRDISFALGRRVEPPCLGFLDAPAPSSGPPAGGPTPF